MQTVQEKKAATENGHSSFRRKNELKFPETVFIDGEAMGEATKHYKLIRYLSACLEAYFAERQNVFVAANLNVYYDETNSRSFFAPDVMICFGVENKDRTAYHLAEEKTFPQVVFEVASHSTYEMDLGKKYVDYNDLGADEYYLLDSSNEFLPTPLIAYQRETVEFIDDNGNVGTTSRLVLKRIENDRVLSPLLGLEIVKTEKGFRLFNAQTEEFLLTLEEALAKLAKLTQSNGKQNGRD